MSLARNVIFLVVGLAVFAGGWFIGRDTGQRPAAVTAGALVFPSIAPALQNAARIEITSKGKTIAIARKPDGEWGLADRGFYPVVPVKLREMLTGLTELRLAEERTSDPTQFARLGLDDPAKPDSTATQLRVLDAAGKPIADLITGHRRTRTQGGGPGAVTDSIYIRRPGEIRTWLADGRLAVDADASLWLDRDVMNIPLAKVARLEVKRDNETLVLKGDGTKMELAEPAGVENLDSYKLEETGRALESLTLLDVREAKDTPNGSLGTQIGTGTYTTTDGIVVAATLFKDGEAIWARFAVSGGNTDEAKAEAARIGKRVAGWAYQVGAWKEKGITPLLADLKQPPPQAPAATPGQTPAPTGTNQ